MLIADQFFKLNPVDIFGQEGNYQQKLKGSAERDERNDSGVESISCRERRIQRLIQLKKEESYATFSNMEKRDDLDNLFLKYPRKTMCVLNAGYASIGGVDGEQLEAVFKPFKNFERVVTLHGKPYSFVVFRGGEDAVVARNALHEKPCTLFNGKTLFLEYINHIDFAEIANKHLYQRTGNAKVTLDESVGFYYIPNFITLEEHKAMIESILADDERKRASVQSADKRWFKIQERFVKHYGNSFDYHLKHIGSKSLVASEKFPSWILPFIERAAEKVPSFNGKVNQLTIQKYPVGSGISFHTDSHTSFEDTVLVISLLTPVAMDFRHPATRAIITKDLEPCSLVVMQGEARYGWEHAIRIRRSDLIAGEARERQERWSMTMRTLNESMTCHCNYPGLCDNNSQVVRRLREERKAAKSEPN
ncbi:hypothetical protein H4219_000547 [Mycoemilia scoparia]|uniref:Fe2OG dioxygenase domain-containing protein n=1 Tax=Mycoemilia scoparia TaxID=417184 RepID=A0A9W8A376_9FUNG|nr:hypothetical protein H4219_000547 [Mycoemilia scoparia]